MTKRGKRLDHWYRNPPTDAPKDQVIAMLDYYFPGQYKWEGGSHIVITDERLLGIREYGPAGDFTIPVKSGKKVKGIYLQRLANVIDLLFDKEGEEE